MDRSSVDRQTMIRFPPSTNSTLRNGCVSSQLSLFATTCYEWMCDFTAQQREVPISDARIASLEDESIQVLGHCAGIVQQTVVGGLLVALCDVQMVLVHEQILNNCLARRLCWVCLPAFV